MGQLDPGLQLRSLLLSLLARARPGEPNPQLRGLAAVTEQAEGPEIIEIAFASALCHRDDMIGVPQCSPADPLQTPARQQLLPMRPARAFQIEIRRAAIDPANRADTLIPLEYLLP